MLPQNSYVFSKFVKSVKALVDKGCTPSEVIKSILAHWMAISFPDLTREYIPVSVDSESSVINFAEWLSECDLITGAFWLSSAYAAMLPKHKRKSNAMYFTPPRLTDRILDNIEASIPIESGPIIDPACGGGAFLAPAAIRIVEKLHARGLHGEAILSHLENNIFGCEVDDFLCWLSKAFLRMAVAQTIKEAGREPVFKILHGDSLKLFEDVKQNFQIVLCNPPYRKMTKVELEPYFNTYSEVIKGQPNLYSLFIQLTTRLLKPNGIGAILTPMSFLSGQSFAPVRRLLNDCGTVKQLDLIHQKDGIFLFAEQDTVITTWRSSSNNAFEEVTQVFCLEGNEGFDFVGSIQLPIESKPWPIPRNGKDKELFELFNEHQIFLEDYGYSAKIGTLVFHRDKRPRYISIEQADNPQALMPLIWSKNICQNGKFSFNRVANSLTERYIDMGNANAAGVIRRPAVAIQRVSSTEQFRRLVAAAVPTELQVAFGGVVGENHVCFLEKIRDDSEITPEMLANILTSKTVDRLFRCISGATNVSAYELKHLPLPDPKKLFDAISQGLEMEMAVRQVFGLSTR